KDIDSGCELWKKCAIIPLSSSMSKDDFADRMKSGMKEAGIGDKRSDQIVSLLNNFIPDRDTIEIAITKKKVIRFSEFGSIYRSISGDLIVTQSDMQFLTSISIGSFRCIHLRGKKRDYMRTFVNQYVKIIGDVIGVPGIIKKLVSRVDN